MSITAKAETVLNRLEERQEAAFVAAMFDLSDAERLALIKALEIDLDGDEVPAELGAEADAAFAHLVELAAV